MRLTMKEKQSVTAVEAARYRKASKKDKYSMLNEFTQLSSYNHCYAAFLLRAHRKRLRVNKKIVLAGDITKRSKRNRPGTYDDKVIGVLKGDLVDHGLHLRQETGTNLKRGAPHFRKSSRDRNCL